MPLGKPMRVKRGVFSVNRAVEPAGHYGDVWA
jgi:hypothetical protein